MLKIKLFLPFLLLIFLLNGTTVFAQEISSVPIEVGNIQIQKASGAAFSEGWNFFTLGLNDCTPRIVLNELQADGGSALKVETLFVKELLGWQPYSILNLDSEKKKIGGGDTLAFNSNQKFFFNMDQKACSNPDKERQAQIDRIGAGNTAKGSFTDRVKELPIDMWTKLMELLNNSGTSSQNTSVQNKQSFENLTIGGKTLVDDLGITGKVSSGLLSINGLDGSFASINTLSNDLYLQNQLLGGINILNGKVTIDTNGNIKSQSNITAKGYFIDTSDLTSATLGSGVIPGGQTSVTILTSAVSNKSKIFVTPSSDTDKPLIVKNRISGKSFDVTILNPYTSDINFDWWVVGIK